MRKKSFFERLWDLDSFLIVYGIFAGLGIFVICLLIQTLIFHSTTITAEKFSLAIQFILGIGFYIPIKKLKEFKYGYVIGILIGITLILKTILSS